MENKKDVTINVTGVSMSGEADINEHNRTSSDNKKESEDEKICDSIKMIDGGESDYQSYIKDVGIAQGIEDACAIIDETLKEINRVG